MDKLGRSSGASGDVQADSSEAVARRIERDFNDLVAIFERQLQVLSEGDHISKRHIGAARAAARRGLQLSRELLNQLRD